MNKEERSTPLVRQKIYDGLEINLTKAPLIKRILAYVIDLSILSCLGYIFAITLGLLTGLMFAGGATFEDEVGKGVLGIGLLILWAIFIVLSIFLSHYYFVWQEHKKGTTIGKKVMGMTVVSLKGGKLSLKQCWIRELTRWVDCILLFPGIITALLSKKSQRIGDHMAGTMVIYSAPQANSFSYLYIRDKDYLYAKEHIQEVEFVPKDTRDFLNFAYRKFIAKESIQLDEESYWTTYVKNHMKVDDDFTLNDQDRILLFAEYCNQKKYEEKKEKPDGTT